MRECDSCGATNGDTAEFCGLCHHAFTGSSGPGNELGDPLKPARELNLAPLIMAVVAALVITVFGWSLTRPSVFAEPSGPKVLAFDWDYGSRSYSLDLTLYQNVYRFYGNQPKGVLIGREEQGLAKYLNPKEGDDTVKDLVASINGLAAQNDLSDEETVELAVTFVQSIPYDFEAVDTADARQPRYAYEVLYDNLGICSEKSYLAYAMLREMGYGVAVFTYPKENHMNIGIQSPLEHSTDQTGYSVVETTNRDIKIGIIPNIDPSGQAMQTQAMQEFNLRNPGTTEGKNLSSPLVYAPTKGAEYTGVVERFRASREIAETREVLAVQSALIERGKSDLDELRSRLEAQRAGRDVRAYNSLVNSYNREAEDLEDLVDEYNIQISRYNALIRDI